MNVISQNKSFEKLLIQCINKHENISLSVAWASANTEVFKSLMKNKNKLKACTIGTHFYQTDPKVLEAFINSKSVRFITQPTGVFHPKVYLFTSNNEWDLIIGSANLTSGALNVNQELCIHLTGKDTGANKVKNTLLKKIHEYYSSASIVSKNDFLAYSEMWEKQKEKRKSLSGKYGSKKIKKSPIESKIMTMGWKKYSAKVKKDPEHKINERIELLKVINNAFKKYSTYQEMPKPLRKTIAGLPNDLHENWGWFGSMKGFGVYHSEINNNNHYISKALNEIPLVSSISKNNYNNFIKYYKKAFPDTKIAIGTASTTSCI